MTLCQRLVALLSIYAALGVYSDEVYPLEKSDRSWIVISANRDPRQPPQLLTAPYVTRQDIERLDTSSCALNTALIGWQGLSLVDPEGKHRFLRVITVDVNTVAALSPSFAEQGVHLSKGTYLATFRTLEILGGIDQIPFHAVRVVPVTRLPGMPSETPSEVHTSIIIDGQIPTDFLWFDGLPAFGLLQISESDQTDTPLGETHAPPDLIIKLSGQTQSCSEFVSRLVAELNSKSPLLPFSVRQAVPIRRPSF